MLALTSISLEGLGEPRQGKVRDVYDLGDKVLIVATDRISAFDVVMANGIPGKGVILNQLSAFWFEKLAPICPHHLLTIDDVEIARQIGFANENLRGRCALAKKAQPLAIECVARGYITGSLFAEYQREGNKVHGLNLPAGLQDGAKLPEPIFTPATKAQEGHDENLSWRQAVDLVGLETAETVRAWTLQLYEAAAKHAENCGIILADTKFEFGETSDGLTWIDEALTPDSSRFWEASEYKVGQKQPSFDKQFLRDYLVSTGWNKQPPGPALPEAVIQATQERYVEAYRRLTAT